MIPLKVDRHRCVLACLLLTAACVASAPASGAGTVLRTGTTSDPSGDGPAGLDLRSLHASYSPAPGAFTTTVTMHGRLSRPAVVIVAFGTQDPAGGCDRASAEEVVFSAGSEAATWAPLDATAHPARLLTTRIVPAASTTMYSGLTASTYRNTAYDCATVAVKGSSGAIADAAETLLSDAADGLEPVTPASPTVLQIDDQYGGVAHRAGDRIPVTVTCLVASSRHCSGRLALTQQSTHTNLGRLRFTLPLGTSRTIRVPVHLTPALRRLKTLFVVERLSADHGRSTRTVTDVKHAD